MAEEIIETTETTEETTKTKAKAKKVDSTAEKEKLLDAQLEEVKALKAALEIQRDTLRSELLAELKSTIAVSDHIAPVPITQPMDVPFVDIFIPIYPGGDRKPFECKWGNRQFAIPRGRTFSVPAPVKEIYETCVRQDMAAEQLMVELEAQSMEDK